MRCSVYHKFIVKKIINGYLQDQIPYYRKRQQAYGLGMMCMRSNACHKLQNKVWNFADPSWPIWFVFSQSEYDRTNRHSIWRQRRYLWGRTKCDKSDTGVSVILDSAFIFIKTGQIMYWRDTWPLQLVKPQLCSLQRGHTCTTSDVL